MVETTEPLDPLAALIAEVRDVLLLAPDMGDGDPLQDLEDRLNEYDASLHSTSRDSEVREAIDVERLAWAMCEVGVPEHGGDRERLGNCMDREGPWTGEHRRLATDIAAEYDSLAAPSRHAHGNQPCDPSEEAAIAQWKRDEGPLRHVAHDSAHVAEWDCWCHPTAERQPNGTYLFIHRKETV